LLPQAPGAVPWTVAVELADAAQWQVKLHARNAWAGLLVAPGADAGELAKGVAGRAASLVARGALVWDNIKPRYSAPVERAQS
jgi:hypothetical protein